MSKPVGKGNPRNEVSFCFSWICENPSLWCLHILKKSKSQKEADRFAVNPGEEKICSIMYKDLLVPGALGLWIQVYLEAPCAVGTSVSFNNTVPSTSMPNRVWGVERRAFLSELGTFMYPALFLMSRDKRLFCLSVCRLFQCRRDQNYYSVSHYIN